MKIKNNSRRAMVTIEFAFGLIASAIVLMLVIGLFHDNVSTMVANSRFQALFDREKLANQTKFDDLAKDPTEIVVTSGTTSDPLTGTTAVEGLEWWQGEIMTKLTDLYNISLQRPYTSAEMMDLARLATLARVAMPEGIGEIIPGTNKNIGDFAYNFGVKGLDEGYTTKIIGHDSVSWDNDYYDSTCINKNNGYDVSADDIVNNITAINKAFGVN